MVFVLIAGAADCASAGILDGQVLRLPGETMVVQRKVQAAGRSPQADCLPRKPVPRWDRCVEQICGQGGTASNMTEIVEKMTEKASKNADADESVEVLNKLFFWMGRRAQVFDRQLALLEQQLEDKQVSIDPALQRFHDAVLLFTFLSSATFADDASIESLTIDRKKTSARLRMLPRAEREWVTQALQAYYRQPEVALTVELGMEPIDRLYRRKYPDLSFAQAVKKDIAGLRTDLDALRKGVMASLDLPRSLLDSIASPSLIEEVDHGKRTDQQSLERIFVAAVATRQLAAAVGLNGGQSWLPKRRSAASAAPLLQSGEVLKRVRQARAFIASKQATRTLAEQVVRRCFGNYLLSQEMLPSLEELERGRQMVDGVRLALDAAVLGKLSQSTASRLRGHLKRIDAIFPPPAENVRKDFSSGLETEIRQAEESSAFFERNEGKPVVRQAVLTNLYDFLAEDWSPEASLKREFSYCDRFATSEVGDAALPDRDVFWVSWMSLRNPVLGRGVVAHELGHFIGEALASGKASAESFSKFSRTQKCLAEMHPEAKAIVAETVKLDGGGATELKTHLYDAEDFADLVSAVAVPEVNPGCGLLGRGEVLSLVNANAEDSHSSNLFRTLHVRQLQAGALPQVCSQALAGERQKRVMKACF